MEHAGDGTKFWAAINSQAGCYKFFLIGPLKGPLEGPTSYSVAFIIGNPTLQNFEHIQTPNEHGTSPITNQSSHLLVVVIQRVPHPKRRVGVRVSNDHVQPVCINLKLREKGGPVEDNRVREGADRSALELKGGGGDAVNSAFLWHLRTKL
jgi:hypothetical protein